MSKFLKFKMTRRQALRWGLLTCGNCGYPENNHFDGGAGDHGKGGCAHDSSCRAYREVARHTAGELIK